ncbi:hypothetical protein BLL42_04960 [Pseudomonas frederiksbergensis]|uniref:Zona occludens toxin N-terminal domain-containing protein n=1 Tax=Pseudomonas frederiksbergensis TaxID=104087 RepID=A0A1J0EG62_9PSED|nr:hypothetical protein [Pseudomonas frederiksbergensis]APC15098.1 hypothetical protein BLL42_04960 [Pseudomonas frederiksbergensis]
MTQKIAYLDISPRQTGKTSRLVKLANQLSADGHLVVYVAIPALVNGLREQMPHVTVLADGARLLDSVDPLKAIWFYDEFDWLTSTEIRQGGYYATTAQRVRTLGVDNPDNDLLMRLLEANGFRFERHFWPFGLEDDWLNTLRAEYTPEQFRALFLGEFLQ